MVERRRILITNDDGYTAEGLQVLADALEGMAEVWVVAPNSEQSGVSHALTLDRPLRMERLGERRFAVDGTPTDCVTLGISIFSKSSRQAICTLKCRDTTSLAWSVRTTSVSSMMPKSVL
jgi:5'-nucleotidase